MFFKHLFWIIFVEFLTWLVSLSHILLFQGLTANGLKLDHVFFGDISAQHKCGNISVDVKIDSNSNVRDTIFVMI